MPAPASPMDRAALLALGEAFSDEHERTYGHRAGPEEPVELVNIRVLGRGVRAEAAAPRHVADQGTGSDQTRRAFFGPEFGWQPAPVLARGDLAERRPGPLIVEEYDATCVVPPDAEAWLDDAGEGGGKQAAAAEVNARKGTLDAAVTEILSKVMV